MMTTNTCKKCGCEDKALTTPAPCPTPVGCPDPEPCSEVFDAQCVIYTGNNIDCGRTTVVSANDNVAVALQNIVDYFCERLLIASDITCDQNLVVPAGATVTNAIINVVEYFCNNAGGAITVVDAGTGIDVTSVTVGNTTTYTVALAPVAAKELQYYENIEPVQVSAGPTPSVYAFPTAGYSALSYTNTTGSAKTYKVHGSYDTNMASITANSSDFSNWVDGAIIKTVASVDTIQWQSSGNLKINGFLFWGPNGGDVIGSGTPTHLLPDNQGSNVNFRFLTATLPRNVAFFKLITLNPGESVSLKFKTKDGATPSVLLAAQLLVEEI